MKLLFFVHLTPCLSVPSYKDDQRVSFFFSENPSDQHLDQTEAPNPVPAEAMEVKQMNEKPTTVDMNYDGWSTLFLK